MKNIAALLILTFAPNLFACSCKSEYFISEEAYEYFPAVAIVKVVSAKLVSEVEEDYKYEQVVAKAVTTEVLKGAPAKEIEIHTGPLDLMCSDNVTVGSSYLAYIDEANVSVVGACSATTELQSKFGGVARDTTALIELYRKKRFNKSMQPTPSAPAD